MKKRIIFYLLCMMFASSAKVNCLAEDYTIAVPEEAAIVVSEESDVEIPDEEIDCFSEEYTDSSDLYIPETEFADISLILEAEPVTSVADSEEELIIDTAEEIDLSDDIDIDSLLAEAVTDARINISVEEYGAYGNDKKDDTYAIQEALNSNKGTSEFLDITFPKGTYYISDALYVYSNTYIHANGATFILDEKATDVATMLSGGHVINGTRSRCGGDSCKHGGYTQINNVTIDGGIWNRNSKASRPNYKGNIFRFLHSDNVTIKNAEFCNASQHMLNLSGSRNATVDHCAFHDQINNYSGSATIRDHYKHLECVHLDNITPDGENHGFPVDGTNVKNATIKNCTFNNVFCGVGNHHSDNTKTTNLTVTGNTFTNVTYKCVMFYGMVDSIISNNTCNGSEMFIHVNSTSDSTISGNTISNVSSSAIYIDEGADIIVKDNKISSANFGIEQLHKGKAVIKNNTFKKCGEYAIYVFGAGTKSSITGNTISNSGSVASIKVYGGASASSIENNKITNAKEHAICTNNADVPLISGNTIEAAAQRGIIACSPKAIKVTSNNVTSVNDCAIVVTGGNGYKTTATVDSNTAITTKGEADIKVFRNCTNCVVTNNTIGKKGFKPNEAVKKSSGNKPKFSSTSLSSVKKASKGSLTVKWKKKTGIDGYQISYSTSSSFKSAKTITINSAKTTSKKITKLKSGKKYYVRVRTFYKTDTETYYSSWSKSKNAKA